MVKGVVVYIDDYEVHGRNNLSEEQAHQFQRCHQESKDNFVKAFSGFGCPDVQVYHKPDYLGFQKIFDDLTDFYYSEPDKKKVLLFAYSGHG